MFLLALAYRKNFYDSGFLQVLSPDGVVFDASSFNVQALPRFVATAVQAQADVYVDPVNMLDQSPVAARPALYERLPYARGQRLTAPLAQQAVDGYVEPIVDFQLAHSPSAVIAPYFYADSASLSWLRASLDAADSAARIVNSKAQGTPVWTGIAIAGTVLTTAASRNSLLALLRSRTPQTVYLAVAATQATAAPMADAQLVDGLLEIIDTVRGYGGRVIVARRYVSGYFARVCGAAGWTTGITGTHQNLSPPPLGKQSGGQGADWVFLPAMLNSFRLTTRAALVVSHPGVVAPRDQYEVSLFQGNSTRTSLSTAQRIMMHRHNLVALRDLDRNLAQTAPEQQRASAKAPVAAAKSTYATINRPWLPGESPDFLDVWDSVL